MVESRYMLMLCQVKKGFLTNNPQFSLELYLNNTLRFRDF